MTSPRLLLAAGSVAASLVGIAPVASPGATLGSAPIRVGAAGISVSIGKIVGADARAKLVVPEGVTKLVGAVSGSAVLAARTRVTVARSSDGATIFAGSLATLHSLPVSTGTKLVVSVQRPVGYAGLKAVAMLSWS
jgi:hypothetical protein